MIHPATEEFLSRYCGEGGEPLFLNARHFEFDEESYIDPNELTIHSGCLEFVFDVSTNNGIVIHNYTIDAYAEPGSLSPLDFIDKSDLLQQQVVANFLCPHLEVAEMPSQLFAYSRFLAPALSEGGLLDGPFSHNLELGYLDPGYESEVALVVGKLVKDVFRRFQSFDCECAAIANEALSDLSETFKKV